MIFEYLHINLLKWFKWCKIDNTLRLVVGLPLIIFEYKRRSSSQKCNINCNSIHYTGSFYKTNVKLRSFSGEKLRIIFCDRLFKMCKILMMTINFLIIWSFSFWYILTYAISFRNLTHYIFKCSLLTKELTTPS